LSERYGEKGLSVLGVTLEDKKDTENWIKSKGVKYAYAYDKAGRLHDKLGVEGIPHAFLIDPQGKIVWEGHPASLTTDIIEKALGGALPKPLFDLPANTTAVRNAISKHNYSLALAEAGKVGDNDGGPELKRVVMGLITGRVTSMNAALKEGDFLGAEEMANACKKELEGLPEAAEADKALAEIKGNKDAERVIGGQKKLRAMQESKATRKKDLEKMMTDLDKLAKDYAGTFVAKEAATFREAVVKRHNAK
jgi:hypothetical protein